MPESFGFFFPGQGAQYVGMGADLTKQYPAAKQVYDRADQILGYSVSKICFEGPAADLTRTYFAQPAIFVTSFAVLEILKRELGEIKPVIVAGLSLGEFTALVAAGALSFEEGLRLVQKRAEAMERSAEKFPGTMASILGLALAECETIAKEAGCEVANINAVDQIVMSGTESSIEAVCRLAESKGAKRAIRLKVGGAFHSSLMRAAKKDLESALSQTEMKRPVCDFIPNVVGEPVADPNRIKELLASQLMSSVQWEKTMSTAAKKHISLFLEIGPGKILRGLGRKHNPALAVESCGSVEDIQRMKSVFAGV